MTYATRSTDGLNQDLVQFRDLLQTQPDFANKFIQRFYSSCAKYGSQQMQMCFHLAATAYKNHLALPFGEDETWVRLGEEVKRTWQRMGEGGFKFSTEYSYLDEPEAVEQHDRWVRRNDPPEGCNERAWL